jgi:hypothetical protein
MNARRYIACTGGVATMAGNSSPSQSNSRLSEKRKWSRPGPVERLAGLDLPDSGLNQNRNLQAFPCLSRHVTDSRADVRSTVTCEYPTSRVLADNGCSPSCISRDPHNSKNTRPCVRWLVEAGGLNKAAGISRATRRSSLRSAFTVLLVITCFAIGAVFRVMGYLTT